MKSRKITAWILFVAMIITMLPSSFVFALAPDEAAAYANYPTIITSSFGDITNDADGVVEGTDLDIKDDKDYEYSADLIPAQDVSAGIVDESNPDNDMGFVFWKNADEVVKHYRRRQFLNFGAKSNAEEVLERSFRDENTDTKITQNAVEIAYMDADKEPLVIKDGEKFEMTKSTWDEAWIDLSTDIQRTNVNLNTFLKGVDSHGDPLVDLNTGVELDNSKLAVADLAATGDQISFMIYNVVNGEFSGYLRIKITDNSGKVTIQDYPFVADGQYPEINIETTTMKNSVGEDIASEHKNTFIASADFEQVQESVDEENRKISKRYAVVDESALNAALNWEDETYKPEDIWVMNDVLVDTLKVSDSIISSEIESVTYTLQHYPDSVVLAGNKTPYESGEVELYNNGDYSIIGTTDEKIVIPAINEGLNILTIVATDNAGLVKTDRYYFFIDKEAPKAEFELVELDKNVFTLFTDADVVTNRQQAIDMNDSADVIGTASLISDLRAKDVDGNPVIVKDDSKYQYRLLATKDGAAEEGIPAGYTKTAPVNTNLTYGEWITWTDETTVVIGEEFDGIIQVRVQDRAGNWSDIISETSDGKETIITDNKNPLITVKEYALDEEGDVLAQKQAMVTQNATNILDVTEEAFVETDGVRENEKIHILEGAKAPWISDTAVLEVNITDKDLANEIRSSGLVDGQITVDVDFNDDNETKEIKIWKNDLSLDPDVVVDTFDVTEENFFGDNADKNLTFYIAYEGTGTADVTVSVKDKADVEDGDEYSSIYKVQLKVDKINPYITYKGYDITDTNKVDLLELNTEYDRETTDVAKKVDYEARNMPWGPNSQVLEVTVKDDDITSVQSKVNTIKFRTDKAVDLYDGRFQAVASYAPGSENIVSLDNCEALANEKYESNVGYKFYLVYEGTGIAKVEFFADDSATEPNVRDYPSVATAIDAVPVEYDAMLRVDKIAPKFDAVELKEIAQDVIDVELFGLTNVDSKNVTRKQMLVEFDILDNISTDEQSGVTLRYEKPIIVKEDYNSLNKDNLYNNREIAYSTDDNLEEEVSADNDPLVDYILIPTYNLNSKGKAGTYALKDKDGEYKIEELTDEQLKKKFNAEWVKADAAEGYWQEDKIVIPNEFQGAIILRTTDRVGNVVYSDPITFVAESKSPLVKFETVAPEGKEIWETLNQYGWSKRDVYFEVKVKDQTESDVDAGLAKVMLQANVEDAMTLEGEAIGPVAKEISLDGLEKDEEGYISLGFVKATKTASLIVTVYDKADIGDADETGNKTVAMYNVRIDRNAPVAEMDAVDFTVKNNEIILNVDMSKLSDDAAGIAPLWNADDYNKFTEETLYDVLGDIVGEKGEKLHYYFKNSKDIVDYNTIPNKQEQRNGYVHENYNEETEVYDAAQWEILGVQYALIPENGSVTDVPAWNFEVAPDAVYNDAGYHEKKMGAVNVWHNYVPGETVAQTDFDGYIVVRVVDKAGNITLLGTSSILDIEFDNDWKNETQFIQVKASEKNGTVTDVEYFGNNDLLFPDGVHRSLTEALSGEGAFIEVVNEGITNVVIKSKTDITAADPVALSDWEGTMNIGSLNKDWKYQFVDVKIDKTAPTFKMNVPKTISDTDLTIEITDAKDPIPNEGIEGMSQICSGIEKMSNNENLEKIEWCKIPVGFAGPVDDSENNIEWFEEPLDDNGSANITIPALDYKAFKGTIKVRITDRAGNVTEKTHEVRVDGTKPIISISKSHNEKCSHEPVDVFVTVSESVEFSDIARVWYTLNNDSTEIELPLTGGTISISDEGTTVVKVNAETKSGNKLESPVETNVIIHYEDLAVPSLTKASSDEVIKPNDWILDSVSDEGKVTGVVNVKYPTGDTPNDVDNNRIVYYSLNGSTWQKVVDNRIKDLTAGANTIRLQARCENCICESDVVTYVVNYDDGVAPKVEIIANGNATKNDAVVNIIATKGDSASNISFISYDLLRIAGTEGEPRRTRTLAANGGNIVLSEEGQWVICNVKVMMESGVEHLLPDELIDDDKIIVPSTNDKNEIIRDEDGNIVYEEISKMGVARVIIDKTAPKIEKFELVDTKDFALFAVEEPTVKQAQKKLNVLINDMGSGLKSVEYAVVEKGAQPEWKLISITSGTEYTTPESIITKAFDGSVMLRVTDNVGNEAIATKTLFTEGIAPEISATAPSSWQTEDFMVKVDVVDKGVSSTIKRVNYKLYEGNDVATAENKIKAETTFAETETLSSIGGSVEINKEGENVLAIIAEDYAGNIKVATVVVKLDKTAPEYSGLVELLGTYNEHEIPEGEWDEIHDGWTYNQAVSLEGIADNASGIKRVDVEFTSKSGEKTSTVLFSSQTNCDFTESGSYTLNMIDNAGNVRNINFVIDTSLDNVINVVEIDETGRIRIAETSENREMISFYGKENSESRFNKLYNGVTNQIWDGRTGVRYIYGQNDSGKKSNTLYVIVAPSTEYGISLMSLTSTPNRYLNIYTEGENIDVKKVAEIFNPLMNEDIPVGSILEINEDGVYSITTNN